MLNSASLLLSHPSLTRALFVEYRLFPPGPNHNSNLTDSESITLDTKNGKGSPYSIAERMVPELAVSVQVT